MDMKKSAPTLADKVAMYLGGGLVLLGVVVLGIVEILTGAPMAPAAVTNEAGEVVASPTISPDLRAALVLLGLLVWLLYGIYRVATPMSGAEGPAPAGATE